LAGTPPAMTMDGGGIRQADTICARDSGPEDEE
jgi:hypothetical protein